MCCLLCSCEEMLTTMYDGKQCGIYYILGNYIALFSNDSGSITPPTATINTYFMLTAKCFALISDIQTNRNPLNVISDRA